MPAVDGRFASLRRVALGVSGTLAAIGPTHALAQGCAMCGSALNGEDPLSRAFSWSVLFLMAAPYTIFGSVAAWLYFTYRRAPGRRRAAIIDLGRSRRAAPAEGDGGDLL